jgi:O-antigen/teichoic acid export membrane protein
VETRQIQESKSLRARIVSGSVVLLSGSGLATAISLAYNVVVARFLGPRAYGNATAVYTLLILISAVTLAFQIVSAKVVAQQQTAEGKFAVYRYFHRASWMCGIAVAVFLLIFEREIASYLNLPDVILVVLLAVGAAFYVPLGSRRGYMQGAYGFRRLATNLVLEGAVRLGGSFLAILAGFGVECVISANAAAVAAAYFAAVPAVAVHINCPIRSAYAFRETLQSMVFFAGQALINNCDIVLVKHFFEPRQAGLYAAVAMVGRVIFAFSSAVVNTMFPLVAGTSNEERRDLGVISTSLLLVLGIGSVLALGLRIAPASIWTTFFGAQFAIAGKFGLPYLLSLYAITTVIYSLSVVIITYEMSYKISSTSWIQLAFTTVLIGGICRYHDSLRQVIWVQLDLMIVLFGIVSIPFLGSALVHPARRRTGAAGRAIRVLRRVSEDLVISEFLRSDFRNPVYAEYQGTLDGIVQHPNLDDPAENAKRRALLFLRHRSLWKELPHDTEWFEVEIKPEDLAQVRIFPRAQWRKFARGDFSFPEVARRLRRSREFLEGEFPEKLDAIGARLMQENHGLSAILLIGVNENEPLTILDGNHRVMAATLASLDGVSRLRFLCGLSPRMTECCWYNTNLITLFRYGRNVLRHLTRNPEAELTRLLQSPG